MESAYTVRPLVRADLDAWRRLYFGYLNHYKLELSASQLDRVWGWLHDAESELEAVVATASDGRVVGLAHFRNVPSPSTASADGFLDDLFVDPEERGRGVADELLTALRDLATTRGWSVLQWITADDNYRARAKYDKYAQRTSWLTYEMPIKIGDSS